MRKEKILVTGAGGQLGTVLVGALRNIWGVSNVLATDLRPISDEYSEILNVTDGQKMAELVQKHKITQIYHLAAILSATGELKPRFTWDVNMSGLLNVLEIGRTFGLSKIYSPSSIAVYGPNTPIENTPQQTVLDPTTVYGISKLAGELWSDYYYKKYGLDVRSLRYPGLIGYEAMPGGGTTDYAVDIFYKAIQENSFECFLGADTMLPMMYMPDAIRGTLELMEAPSDNISVRSSYNISAMSFTPAEIAREIQGHLPDFQMGYKVDDLRQNIANSWSDTIDDSAARQDWNWKEAYSLKDMTADMILNVGKKLKRMEMETI
ncbi:MAG: NAD-dependent epimerase/dehydratase family protein [Saprospiraceae bacterium]